jgi:hypothetical protein
MTGKIAYYVYILFDEAACKPIYAGSTRNPCARLSIHTKDLKKQNITPVMAIYKKVYSKKRVLKEENNVITYLVNKFGSQILNKNMKSCHYSPYDTSYYHKINYTPKIKWIYLSKEEKVDLFSSLPIGSYSKISRRCSYSPERIRQLFIRKPDKIHPEIHDVILKYKNSIQHKNRCRPA